MDPGIPSPSLTLVLDHRGIKAEIVLTGDWQAETEHHASGEFNGFSEANVHWLSFHIEKWINCTEQTETTIDTS